MKVYIIMEDVPYEGAEIKGVYATESGATAGLAALVKDGYYTYTIDAHEVQP